MANPRGTPENLISIGDRSEQEKKAITSKGGRASVKKKKEKMLMNEVARTFLNLEMSDKEKESIKKNYNLDDAALTKRFPLVAQLYGIINTPDESAVNRMAAMRLLIELAGESPSQLAMKESAAAQKNVIEDDPFSKSLKAMFGSDEK